MDFGYITPSEILAFLNSRKDDLDNLVVCRLAEQTELSFTAKTSLPAQEDGAVKSL